ncbi:MAG: hypothetical protein ACYTFK_12910 [Planctomycetota bacterium]|jgi:hypothetical protein
MSKYRRSAKIDSNQPEIVKALLKIPGVSVQTGVDDIFVGYKGRNYWYEIKAPDTLSEKTGLADKDAFKKSQINLLKTWTGHYEIVWTLEEILEDMGTTKG